MRLDTAYVRIEADSRDGEREASRAGERFGRAFADSADREAGRSTLAGTLAAQVERASARVAAARDAEVNATTRVRRAEAALDALRASGKARADQLAASEERLATAKLRLLAAQDDTDAATRRLGQAQSALQSQLARSESSTTRLSGAMGRLRRDSDIDFSRLVGGAGRAGGAVAKLGAVLSVVGVAGTAMQAALGGGGIALAGLASGVAQVSGLAAALPAVLGAVGLAVATLKIGFSGFFDALNNVGDARKFEESLRNLAPAAQDTARAVAGLKPAFDALRLDVQQRLFSGLAGPVLLLGQTYLPILRTALASTADGFNQAFRATLGFLNTPAVVRDIASGMGQITVGVRNASGALKPFVAAFTDLFAVGATFMPRLGQSISDAANRFASFISRARETGQIQRWIEKGITAAKQFGSILGNLGSALAGVFRAANAATGGFLAALDSVTEEIARVINSVEGQAALTSFFAGARDAINALKPAVGGVIQVIGALGPALSGIGKAVGPALGIVLNALAQGITNITPGVIAFAAGFTAAAQALAPLLPLIGIIGSAIGTTLGAALQLVTPLLSGLVSVLSFLSPILGPLASGITAVVIVLGTVVGVGALVSRTLGLITTAWRVLSLAFAVSPLGLVIVALAALAAALIYAYQNSETFRAIVGSAFRAIGDIVVFVMTTVVEVIRRGVDGARSAIQGMSAFGNMVRGWIDAVANAVRSGIDSTVSFFAGLPGRAMSAINALSSIGGTVQGWMNGLSNAVRSGIDSAVSFAASLPGRLMGALSSVGNLMSNVGRAVIDGIARGIQNGWNYLLSLVHNLAQSLFNAAKRALGIGSPSKVFASVGEDSGLGVIKGLDRITPRVIDTAREMAAAVAAAARVNVSAALPQVTAPTTSRIREAVAAAQELAGQRGVQAGAVLDQAERVINNIVIHNPQAERSSDSINRELRKFAALGGFAR